LNAAPVLRLPPPEDRMRQLPPPWIRTLRTGGALALVSTVLALVFGLYSRPDFMLQMANQLWSCF